MPHPKEAKTQRGGNKKEIKIRIRLTHFPEVSGGDCSFPPPGGSSP